MSAEDEFNKLQGMFQAVAAERQQKESANEALKEMYVNNYGRDVVFGVGVSARSNMARGLLAEDCRACWHVFEKYIDQVEAEAFDRGIRAADRK